MTAQQHRPDRPDHVERLAHYLYSVHPERRSSKQIEDDTGIPFPPRRICDGKKRGYRFLSHGKGPDGFEMYSLASLTLILPRVKRAGVEVKVLDDGHVDVVVHQDGMDDDLGAALERAIRDAVFRVLRDEDPLADIPGTYEPDYGDQPDALDLSWMDTLELLGNGGAK